MNAKQIAPIVASLAAAAPPLLVIGGLTALAIWLLSDDDKKETENAPVKVAPETKPLRIGFNLGRNPTENRGIPPNSGGKSSVLPAPAAFPANPAPAATKIPVQPTSSTGQTAQTIATPASEKLRIPPVSSGNTVQSRLIPSGAGGKAIASLVPAASVSPTSKISASVPSVIPVAKAPPEISSPVQKKTIRGEDVAKIFKGGHSGLTRKSAVAALKALGFGKTAAYEALAITGRFKSWLQFAPDGIITWKN